MRLWYRGGRERERESKRERERERKGERGRDRDREIDRQTGRQASRHTQWQYKVTRVSDGGCPQWTAEHLPNQPCPAVHVCLSATEKRVGKKDENYWPLYNSNIVDFFSLLFQLQWSTLQWNLSFKTSTFPPPPTPQKKGQKRNNSARSWSIYKEIWKDGCCFFKVVLKVG